MSRNIIVILGVVLLGLIVLGSGCGRYNAFIELDENVEQAWSNVQTQYQRRTDLIGNLVKTVQGAADFERSTLDQVVEARARATQVQINANDLTPEKLREFQEAQAQLNGALGRLLAVSENYPQLQATQGFRDLQAQIEGTENRVAVARDRYNEAVTDYNKAVRRFPGTLYASIFGFDRKAQFEAEASAQDAPDVEFDF